MATSKPTFIFVPGGFSPGFYFHKVIAQLNTKGYEAISIDHPSVGRSEGPSKSGYDDAAHLRSKAAELLDQGKDVIIVGNSYGGYVTLEASKGLSEEARSAAGKGGGRLRHLILLGSLLPPIGKTVREMISGEVPIETSSETEYIAPIPAEVAGKILCGSLPEDQQLYYGAMGREQSVKAFGDPLTFAAYEVVDTTAVVGKRDLALKPEVQIRSIDEAVGRGMGKGMIRKVVWDSDHCPMLSHPEMVVGLCVEVAGG